MRRQVLIAAALATGIAGCGSGGSKTVTVTTPAGGATQSAPTGTQPSTSTPGSVTSATSTATTATTVTTTRPAAALHLSTFRSPSSNIGCIIFSGGVRCDIKQRNWSPPPRPASCPDVVDFGQGLAVNPSGRGRFVCAGDTALNPQAAALPYGRDATVGAVTCASRTDGITCTETRTGHGFFISVQGYRIF